MWTSVIIPTGNMEELVLGGQMFPESLKLSKLANVASHRGNFKCLSQTHHLTKGTSIVQSLIQAKPNDNVVNNLEKYPVLFTRILPPNPPHCHWRLTFPLAALQLLQTYLSGDPTNELTPCPALISGLLLNPGGVGLACCVESCRSGDGHLTFQLL